jgi:hypothetical protein
MQNKTQEKRHFREGIRKLIINTEPMVGHIAKKAYTKMFIGPAGTADLLLKSRKLVEAIAAYKKSGDLLGISLASLMMGSETNAVDALLQYGFTKPSALSFIGHVFSMDGMHNAAAMLFYASKRYSKAIDEYLAVGNGMTIHERRMLGLAYAKTELFGLAYEQFRLSGATKLAEKMREMSAMQSFPPQKEFIYSSAMGIPPLM